jgi:hypothetical protein
MPVSSVTEAPSDLDERRTPDHYRCRSQREEGVQSFPGCHQPPFLNGSVPAGELERKEVGTRLSFEVDDAGSLVDRRVVA